MKKLIIIFTVFLSACSSNKKFEYAQDRVVQRVNNLKKRPAWVSETVNIKEDDGNVFVIGAVEVPGRSRAQAAFIASDNKAKGHLANKIEENITKIVETAESGFNIEDQSLKTLIRSVSNQKYRNLSVTDRYWEKVVITNPDGEEQLVLKAFSLMEISKRDLKKMIISSTKKSTEAPLEIRNSIENLIRRNWNEIL